MRILAIGHAYMVRINRGKWREMRAQFPSDSISLLVPQRWPDMLFTLNADTAEDFPVVARPTVWGGIEGRYFYRCGLTRAIRETNPDVIHVEQGSDSLVLAQVIAACRWLGVKPKIGFFTWWNLEVPQSRKIRWLEQFNFNHVDYGVCGNRDSEKLMRARGFKRPVYQSAQLGVDEKMFSARPSSGGKRPVIGFIGRLVEEKGVEDLARAWIQLQKEGLDADLSMIGKGPLSEALKDMATANSLSNRLMVAGPFPHEEIVPYLQNMDVLVLPSRATPKWKEQFGHVLTEAMACGVPVIGARSGAIPEVISDAGVLVPERDPAALARAIKTVLTDPAERARLSALGRQRVLGCYTDAALAKRLHTIFQEVLAARETRS